MEGYISFTLNNEQLLSELKSLEKGLNLIFVILMWDCVTNLKNKKNRQQNSREISGSQACSWVWVPANDAPTIKAIT